MVMAILRLPPIARSIGKPATALLLALAMVSSAPAVQADSIGSPEKPTTKSAVLDPNNYVGMVKAGYQAAKEIPEVCSKLFCYCGCDMTDCHGSLLDCFTSDHGVDCHICQEEAIMALKFHRKGKSISDIQKFIDKRYSKEYPFEVESPVLLKYKKERLWDSGKKSASSSSGGEPQADGKAVPGKRKPGKEADGSCCSSEPKKN
jgi:hypothetical protein